MPVPRLRLLLTAAAVTATAATGYAFVAGPASAGTDPVTGGTTTISVAFNPGPAQDDADIYELPTSPASLSYDPTAQALNYSFPVTGGDASVNTFFGTVTHGGGLVIGNRSTRRSVTLTGIVFDIEADTVSATVPTTNGATTSTTIVFFDALGNHDIAAGPPETFSSSDLQLDPAGAKYLNKALHTRAFKPGKHVGTFATSFTNSND